MSQARRPAKQYRIRHAPAPEAPPAPEYVPDEQAVSPIHTAAEPGAAPRSGRFRRPARWLLAALAAAVLVLALVWWRALPKAVSVIRPRVKDVTRTIAASGEVHGRKETAVGAQVVGVVDELRVDEGDQVRQGDILARVRNDVAAAQVRQAEQALETARAQLVQAQEGARPTETAAARARVREAEANVHQREAQVASAKAALTQAEARAELSRRDLQRYRYLLGERAVARQRVEQAISEYRVALADVKAARDGVDTARATLRGAQAGVQAAHADLRTLEAGPKPSGIQVARQRVRDAEAALRVAREQAQNAVVRAPFPGIVTQVVAEVGATVGQSGVVRLVQLGNPEIRLDVDENNLAELKVGQPAVVTSPTYRKARFEGRVTEIGPGVDPNRGTVPITVVPNQAPEWFRPGQTVDVNIITVQGAPHLVVPPSALRRDGSRQVVLIVREGRAQPQPVVTAPVESGEVPILEGLAETDRVVLNAQGIQPGARVRAREGR